MLNVTPLTPEVLIHAKALAIRHLYYTKHELGPDVHALYTLVNTSKNMAPVFYPVYGKECDKLRVSCLVNGKGRGELNRVYEQLCAHERHLDPPLPTQCLCEYRVDRRFLSFNQQPAAPFSCITLSAGPLYSRHLKAAVLALFMTCFDTVLTPVPFHP